MMTNNKRLILASGILCLALSACTTTSTDKGSAAETYKAMNKLTVKENWFTQSLPEQNIDSPATWHGPDGQHWLFATAKAADCVNIYDAFSAEPIASIGTSGSELGQMLRPNGIWTVDNLLLVAERDNKRVQVFTLPDLKPVLAFGQSELQKPYGLCVIKKGPERYDVYVTDNYETPDEEQVPPEQMDRRVRMYKLTLSGDVANAELAATFGDTSGAGILYTVESIIADTARGRLLIADEDMETTGAHNTKIYSLEGKFSGITLADGMYRNQAEGLAMLYADPKESRWQEAGIAGRTYYFLTDQGEKENYYHIYDADSLSYLGSVELEGTLNTDGVWLDPSESDIFPLGAFYAVDDDCRVAAADIRKFLDILRVKASQ
ncbi:MAG: hypothetical protein JW942_02970 [Opitutales bacterium]|nr:hypothetical protein [Opitutales bacterium]